MVKQEARNIPKSDHVFSVLSREDTENAVDEQYAPSEKKQILL